MYKGSVNWPVSLQISSHDVGKTVFIYYTDWISLVQKRTHIVLLCIYQNLKILGSEIQKHGIPT